MFKRPSHDLVAYRRWEKRGRPYWEQDTDRYYADVILKLRPYLAEEAVRTPTQVADVLTAMAERKEAAKEGAVTLVTVLDGGPEYRDARIEEACKLSTDNGEHPERVIEKKDSLFYDICYHTLLLHGANILEGPAASSEAPAERRLVQDACIAEFAGTKPAVSAIAAGLHLARELRGYNDEHPVSWDCRLYPRTVIAQSIHVALAAVRSPWRDEIVVSPEVLDRIQPDSRRLALFAGIEVGPVEASIRTETRKGLADGSRPREVAQR
jgi:hypothetical protein